MIGTRTLLLPAATLGAMLTLAPAADAQQRGRTVPQTLPPGQSRMVGDIKILNVRNNVWVLMGAGGNITALAFPEGVTLVDTGLAASADKVLAAIRTISNQPIRYIINTHVHPDHTGGNEKLNLAGRQITGGNVVGSAPDIGQSAEVIAHENVLNRMIDPRVQPPTPANAQPETTYHTDSLKLSTFYHGDAVQLFWEKAAHSDGDTVVWFRRNDVIATGDIFTPSSYPRIDLDRGGSINGEIDALNHIIEIAFPEFRLENGTLIVPGHGRLCDVADIAYYRDMVITIRDRVQDLMKKGRTLEQIKASKLSEDYDGVYGKDPQYTADQFIETIYKSLSASVKPATPAKPTPKKK